VLSVTVSGALLPVLHGDKPDGTGLLVSPLFRARRT
jgi:hypothetical protein